MEGQAVQTFTRAKIPRKATYQKRLKINDSAIRDAAHIHGSPFMLSFSHASSTKDLPGWYLLSRYQSCRCAFDSFRKGSGLHSFRTCAGRSPEQNGTADLCVHRDAQSLAFCCQTEVLCAGLDRTRARKQFVCENNTDSPKAKLIDS